MYRIMWVPLALLGTVLYTWSQNFPSLGVDHSLLERAQNLEVRLTEALESFEKTLSRSNDAREIAVSTRVLLITVMAFRGNLASRYDQRAYAPVSPPITAEESQKLLRLIKDLMELEALLLELEASALREVEKQYPELRQSSALTQWRVMNQKPRDLLQRRSVRTGLSVKAFPPVRWEERTVVLERAKRALEGCEYMPGVFNERKHVMEKPTEVRLPDALKRFAEHPLPWKREE